MKFKAMAIALCILLTCAPVQAVEERGDALWGVGLNLGQVVNIDPSSLTIAVGNPGERGEGSAIDFNGEEVTASLTENTLYLRSDLWPGEKDKETSDSIWESLNSFLKVFSWGDKSEPEEIIPQEGAVPGPEASPEGEAVPQGGMDLPSEDVSQAGADQGDAQADNLLPGGYEALHVGDYVTLQIDENGNARVVTKLDPSKRSRTEPEPATPSAEPQAGTGTEGEDLDGVDSYESVLTFTEDTQLEDQDIVSNAPDENAVLVQGGAQVSLKGVHISRGNKESIGGELSARFGVGAATLTTDGSLSLDSCIIRTDSLGSAAVFAYENGKAGANQSTLHTNRESSPALAVAGGGTLFAKDVVATTEGKSSPVVCIERGGGRITMDGGSYTALGVDSPAIFTKGEMVLSEAALVATATEAVRMEGSSSVSLTDCYLYGKGNSLEDTQEETAAVQIYRTAPVDFDMAEKSRFEMTGGTLESGNGGLFYLTNTVCDIELNGVDLIPAEQSPFFLCCMGGRYGTTGENGAICSLKAKNQSIQGDILWDGLSSLEVTLGKQSRLLGEILQEEVDGDSEKKGVCSLTLEEGSTWVVTGDSTLTSLSLKGGTLVDEEGMSVGVKDTGRTLLLEGESPLVVTVETLEKE